MPFKIVVTTKKKGREERLFERIFDKYIISIGRDKSNDLQLEDPMRLVSKRHAEIRYHNNLFNLIDMGSKNGTILNNKKIDSGEKNLYHNDQIQIGGFTLFFNIIDSPFRDVVISKMDESDKESDQIIQKEAINAVDLEDIKKSRSKEEINRYAYERICNISDLFLKDSPVLNSKEDIENFCIRIEKILLIMLTCLSDALKGRHQFEQEFGVEVTRILSCNPNRVKSCKDVNELAGYLLDWRNNEKPERLGEALEEAFRDLILHQAGLIAGLGESLNGLLERLSPELIEKETKSNNIKLGKFSLLSNIWPITIWAKWKRFVTKHRELSEDNVRAFEEVFGPEFAKGYLSVHTKRKS